MMLPSVNAAPPAAMAAAAAIATTILVDLRLMGRLSLVVAPQPGGPEAFAFARRVDGFALCGGIRVVGYVRRFFSRNLRQNGAWSCAARLALSGRVGHQCRHEAVGRVGIGLEIRCRAVFAQGFAGRRPDRRQPWPAQRILTG